ncbi:MAG: hypothetical protein OXG13_09220 [Gemmatimonadaceae bacterium]|nr:hypothetical protein [Gemmatimonadaceae bacterium]
MKRDPIVEETRKLREESAAKFGHDRDAIFHDVQRRQSMKGKRLVSFLPRKSNHNPAFPSRRQESK